jgi:hypothetical protein
MRALTTLAGAVLVALVLSGCLPPKQHETPEPHRTATPVFASEEEALAAAEEAYREYLRVSDLIASEGGEDPERLAPFVTPDWLDKEKEVFASIQLSGRRSVGTTAVSSMTLQAVEAEVMSVYVCLDTRLSRVLDAEGIDVTPEDRPAIVDLELTFDIETDGALVLARSEPWPTGSFC